MSNPLPAAPVGHKGWVAFEEHEKAVEAWRGWYEHAQRLQRQLDTVVQECGGADLKIAALQTQLHTGQSAAEKRAESLAHSLREAYDRIRQLETLTPQSPPTVLAAQETSQQITQEMYVQAQEGWKNWYTRCCEMEGRLTACDETLVEQKLKSLRDHLRVLQEQATMEIEGKNAQIQSLERQLNGSLSALLLEESQENLREEQEKNARLRHQVRDLRSEQSRLSNELLHQRSREGGDLPQLLGECGAAEGSDDPEFEIFYDSEELKEENAKFKAVRKAISSLPPKVAHVLQLHYLQEMTLDAIAREMKLSRERIRQLRDKGIRMMRHPSRVKLLAGDAQK